MAAASTPESLLVMASSTVQPLDEMRVSIMVRPLNCYNGHRLLFILDLHTCQGVEFLEFWSWGFVKVLFR